MVETLNFPKNSYKKHSFADIKEFDFSAMILTAVNRYCFNLIFCEIINKKPNYEQTINYNFSDFEIKDLSQKKPEDIIWDKKIKTKYDFSLSLLKKRYSGVIEIATKLITKGSFENSYYQIKIKITPNESLKIYPFFLTETGFIGHLSEFFQKIWKAVWIELAFIGKLKTTTTNNFEFDNYLEILPSEILNNLNLPNELYDKVFDVLCLSFAIWKKYAKNQSWVHICADDILKLRQLKENKNSLGAKGGYKITSRQNVHSSLDILNRFNLLIVRELTPFNYAICVPYRLRNTNTFKIPLKLIQYNNKTEAWQKRLGLNLLENKQKQLKLKKLYKNVIQKLSQKLAPCKIRDAFENAMDNLAQDGIIKDWHYLNIDEEQLEKKDWFLTWQNLSIKIYHN